MYTHGLGVVGLYLLQALTVVLSGMAFVPQELGVYSLKKLLLCDWGFLMPFSELAVHGMF